MSSSTDDKLQLVTLTWITVMLCGVIAADRCQFPDFLQSRNGAEGPNRKWMSHVVNDESIGGALSCASRVKFFGGRWRQLSPSHRRCRGDSENEAEVSFQRECITSVQRNRYVVRHYDITTNTHEEDDVVNDEDETGTNLKSEDTDEMPFFDVSGSTHFKGYMCVEFILRGPVVVQVRLSTAYRWLQGPSVCDDDAVLQLDDWPLVDFGPSFFDISTPCRLPVARASNDGGGFSVRMFDKALRVGLCDALDSETRIEFGCSLSDDVDVDDNLIDFRFRHAGCVPHEFGMAVEQRVRCVASWSEEVLDGGSTSTRHSFAVLRHDADRRAWCFRFPTTSISSDGTRHHHRGGSFTGHLFRDVRCDRAGQTRLKTNRFLRIDFVPDEPVYDRHVQRSTESTINGSLLCRDDYEACQFWAGRPCSRSSGPETLACPRRCQVCTDDRPASCSLPKHLVGRWKSTGVSSEQGVDGERRTLIVGHNSIQFNHRQSNITLSCVDWDPTITANNSTPRSMASSSSSSSSILKPFERMFVRLFPNGCRPRYVCVKFHRPSVDVLLVRVSRFRSWPFVPEAGVAVQCSNYFSYDDDADYRLFVSAPTSLYPLSSGTRHHNVGDQRCDAQHVASQVGFLVGLGEFLVDFRSGIQCRGRFQTNDKDDYSEANRQRSGKPSDGKPNENSSTYVESSFGEDQLTGATFKVTLVDCPTQGHESEQTYRCIDSIGFRVESAKGLADSMFEGRRLLTKTGDNDDVLCWWFPDIIGSAAASRFYLLTGVACYDHDIANRVPVLSVDAGNATIQPNASILAMFSRLEVSLTNVTAAELKEVRELPSSVSEEETVQEDRTRSGYTHSTYVESCCTIVAVNQKPLIGILISLLACFLCRL